VATQASKAINFSKDAFQQIKNIKDGAQGILGKTNLDFVRNPTPVGTGFPGVGTGLHPEAGQGT
ncbi:hypothetical protein HNS30_39260, partial [Corallococcus exercitus]|nr:hypothetical protein [Corallococcus exercitus]